MNVDPDNLVKVLAEQTEVMLIALKAMMDSQPNFDRETFKARILAFMSAPNLSQFKKEFLSSMMEL
jgi:hypothetical protein